MLCGMSPVKRKRPTTDQTVGENLRRLRLASDLGQGDLASLLQEWWDLGDLEKWNRDTVASVEAGRRSVTLDELMALAGLLRVGIIEFFIDADGTIDDYSREAFLTPPLADRHDAEEINQRMRKNADAHLRVAHILHDPTKDIARRLEVTVVALDRAAQRLWGRSVDAEYTERVIARRVEGMPRRSLAIVRGHVVRGLQKELAKKVQKSKPKTTTKEV
jgi:transcriptional regulator with XRE-family HTH domain